MKNSTFSAQVANNLLTLLQGYSKTIRLLLVMFLTLTVTTNAWGATWEKATSIAAGDVVLLVCESKKMELSGISTTSTKYGTGVSYKTSPAGAYELTVEAGSSTGTYSLKNGSNYLYWSSGNSLATNATKSANSSWSITFNNGNATIKNAKDNARIIGWNASSPRFACYTSSQTAVQLYKKVTAVQTVAVTGVSLNPTSLTLTVGNSETLTATVSPDNATNKTVTWSTSNSSVATVINGEVTAVAEGTAKVTVTTTDGGKTATCNVTVNPKPKYTVTLVPGSGSVTNTELEEPNAGDGVTLPTPTLSSACQSEGWSFAGWKTTSAVTTETPTKPTLIPAGNYKPTANTTLYAVYQRTETTQGGGGTENETYAHSITSKTWSANGAQTLSSISWTLDNNGSYYGYEGTRGQQVGSSGSPAKSMTLTTSEFASSTKITAVRISTSGGSNVNANVSVKVGSTAYTSGGNTTKSLTSTNTEYEFTGSSTGNITISWSQTSSKAIYFKTIEVDYQTTTAGGGSTTYYHSTPDCGGTPEQPTYTITISNDIQNGTIVADKSSAAEGETVKLTVTPEAGYKLEAITVTKATGGIVEVENKTFTMPASNVTVSATFTEIPKYTVSFSTGTGNSTPADISETVGGAGITLPAGPTPDCSEEGWEFGGWSTTNIKDQTTTISELLSAGSTYKPTKNTTLYAVYSKTESAGNGGAQTTATLTNEEIAAKYVNEETTKYGEHTIESESGTWGGMIVIGNLENTKYIQISSDKTNRHLASPTFSANITNITIKGRHNASKTRNIYICSSNETAQPSSGDLGYGSIASSGVENQYTDWTDVSITVSGSHTKFYVYADGGLQIHSIIVTIGGSTTTTYYHSNPCEVATTPTWEPARIDHNTIQVACGSKTQLGAAAPNGPATITFNGYDLQNSVTVTASEGFRVSTNKEEENTYKQEVTVNPHKDGQNIGKIQNVYVIAQAPAQSGDFNGTITLTGADITDGSQVINVTAAVTCTQYTITWSVNGDDSHQVTYSPGDALQLPEIDITPCDGMDHVGWTDNMGYDHGTDILFTETTDMTVTSDKTYYAVFAASTSSDDGAETTLDFSKQNYGNQQEITSLTIDAVTVTFDKGTNSNAPKYYTTGTAVRVYGGGYFTVSSAKTISKIVITFSSGDDGNEITTNVGNYSDNTWTGSANEITFTIAGTKGHRRIKSIEVTSAGGATFYTDYTTTCEGRQLETPTNLQATDITYNGATLTWDAVAGANKYKVVINGTEYISNTNSYTTHDLKPQTAYTWTVQAIGNGTTFTDSEISTEDTFTTGTELVITWSVSTITSTTTITKGQPIGANLKDPASCEGKYFMGWSASSTVNSDGSDFTPITSATIPETNVTYYAVFAEPTGNGGAEGELFSESFNTMNEKGGNDGTWNNITSSTEVSIDGWSFTKGYVANQCIRLGTSSVAGEATTPALDINGNATLTFAAGAWNGNSENLTINLQIVGEGSIKPSSVTLTKGQFNTYTANITGANADTKVQFIAANAATNRFFLDEVKVSGGSSDSYTDYSTSCGTYTVTFYGFNSGGYTTTCNGNPAVDKVEQGGTYVIPNCEPTFDPAELGRTFAGTWNTQANGKGTAYKPGDEITNVSNDITLYAQWALNTSGNITLPTDVEDLATTDVVVTGGTTLTLQTGTTTINSLTLKGGIQADGRYKMPIINIPDNATLKRKSDIIYLDLVVNAKNYYPFAVPFRAKNGSDKDNWDYVGYIDPDLKKAATYRTHFVIKTYDGAKRAENGENRDANWVIVNRDTYLEPGIGYMITAMTAGKDAVTMRIPMRVSDDWFAGGEQTTLDEVTRNTVPVTAHTGTATDINKGGHQRHAGWNFVANPYLSNFTGGTNSSNVEGSFINGEITINNGEYSYGGEKVPYVTIPTYDFARYDQVKLSEATLSPAYSFFVQVGESGTMTFKTAGRQAAPASIAARNAEERPVKMDVDITLSDNHSSDQTGIIISDRYSEAYEIGRDLEKLFGSAYNLSVYTLMADNTPLAFQALAIRSNMQVIPVGYRAPEQGEYTFRLNEATSSIDLLNEQYEQLVLVDYQTGELTNLLISDYTFYSERTQADNRFAIYAVPRQNAPTDLPNAIGQDKQAQKIIHNGHLYILRDGNVYNGNGQIVK